MRAVVYAAVGAEPVVTTVPAPSCPEDGAVVDVRATGVCRSDWHAWRGHDPVSVPHVPGHEFAGVVAQVGPAVTGYGIGDRVTAPFVNGCGRCTWCRRGQAQVCPDQTQPGFTHPGSFAEQVVVHAADTNLVRLPDRVAFTTAAALGCRFATAFRALTVHAELTAGQWVVVFGCGGVGLSTVMIATALGGRVIAVDPSPAAQALAAGLGAEVTLPHADTGTDTDTGTGTDAVREVHRLTGEGAHVAVDAVGSPATAEASVRSLRRRGRHVQVGLMLGAASRAPLPWDLVVATELSVHGSHGMPAADYPALLDLISTGVLAPERLIGAVITLEQAGAALMAMDAPIAARAGTVVVRLD